MPPYGAIVDGSNTISKRVGLSLTYGTSAVVAASVREPLVATMSSSPVSTKPNFSPIHLIRCALRSATFLVMTVNENAKPFVSIAFEAKG